ncbi:MAG: DJ-1/PfpI family protein [Bryobacteraceae bacterium]
MPDSDTARATPKRVAIFLFDEVEVLDFAGPFEVFAVTGQRPGPAPFEVVTVAAQEGPVRARNGLIVSPGYTFATLPPPEIIVIPGGYGTRPLVHDEGVIAWIQKMAGGAELTLSVCTGALLLAKAGLLEGKGATTHWGALDLLRELGPATRVVENTRFVDSGTVITSAGISAGIDMSLHVVARLLGLEQARETARYMEYRWVE